MFLWPHSHSLPGPISPYSLPALACSSPYTHLQLWFLLQGPNDPTWTPATIFLVTDHLYHLLVKNYMRRDTAPDTDDDCFGRAVFRLHDAIFQGYRDWCEHVALPPVLRELSLETLQKYGAVVVSAV